MRTKRLKVLDVFNGAGGFSLGFEYFNRFYDVIAGIDNSEFPNVELTFRFNHKAIFHKIDVNKIKRLPKADVILVAPPCVPYTKTNRARTFDTTLVKKALQLIAEAKPKYFCFENVEELKDLIPPLLEQYQDLDVNIYSLNSADFGAPQRRKRIFFGNFPAPIQTHFDPKRGLPRNTLKITKLQNWNVLRSIFKQIHWKLHNMYHYAFNIELNNPKYLFKYQGLKLLELDSPSPTVTDNHGNTNLILDASGHSGYIHPIDPPLDLRELILKILKKRKMKQTKSDFFDLKKVVLKIRAYIKERNWEMRRLTERECAALQGFPLSFRFYSSSRDNYKMIGNAVNFHTSRAIARAMLVEEGIV